MFAAALVSITLAIRADAQTTTQYVYDAQGRLVSAIDNTGPSVLYAYDPAGNRVRLGTSSSFSSLLPSNLSSSSMAPGITGLSLSGMGDAVFSGAGSIAVTQSEAQPWIRVDFPASRYIHHVRLAPASDATLGIGPANTNGADLEYSNDGGVNWTRATTVSTAAAGVFTNIVMRVNATSVRLKRTTSGRLALGSLGFYSAPKPSGSPTERLIARDDEGVTVASGSSVTVDPLQNDTHADNLPFSISSVGGPLHGTAVKNTAGNRITYTPSAGYTGADSFEYVIADNAGLQAFAVVKVNVTGTAANTAPVATADTATAMTGVATSIPVLANDTDANSDPLTIASVTTPAHGTAVINTTTNTVTYTATGGYVGSDSFSYTASDGRGGTSSLTAVTVTVTAAGNIPPVAVDDTGAAVAGVATTISPLANDTDANGHILTITALGAPTHGTATINSGATSITYTATTGYSGQDGFTYAISDGHGGTDVGLITVTVNATVNTAPTAANDAIATPKGAPVTFNPRGNDSDPDGDVLVVSAVTPPAHGAAVINSGATITYTPTANYSGSDTFTYTISDGRGGTATATVSVTVSPTAASFYQPTFRVMKSGLSGATVGSSSFDIPAASGPSALMSAPPATSFSFEIDVVAAAVDSGALGVANQAWFDAGGAPSTSTPGSAQWYLGENFGYGEASGATATWVNSAQAVSSGDILGFTYSASTRKLRVYRNGGLIGTVTASASASGQFYPMVGSWAGRLAGAFRATPSTHHASYVLDGASNGAPVTGDDNVTTPKNTAVTFNPRSNDTDPNGDALTITAVGTPGHGTAAIVSGATITYTPTSNYVGSDSFTYTVSDGNGGSSQASVNVTVTAPPAANEFMPLTTDTSGDWWMADTGKPYTEQLIAEHQGYRTLFLSKTISTAYYDGSMTNSGSFGLTGAAPGADKWTIQPGERIGTAFELRSLGVTDQVKVSFHYWDGSWQNLSDSTPVSAAISSNAWTRVETIAVAPANARYLAVIVEVFANGDERNAGPHGVAVRKPQLSRLATGQPMPASTETAAANTAPTVVNDNGSVMAGQSVTITPLTNDSDANSDPLTITAVGTPGHGSASINSGATSITYTASSGYSGADSFTYTVSDGRGGSASATIAITVTVPPVNGAPDAVNDVITATAGVQTAISPLINDTDPNNDPLIITAVGTPGHGVAQIGTGGTTILYTPTTGYAGTDSFTYTVSDGRGGSDSATVNATVTAVPPANLWWTLQTNQLGPWWDGGSGGNYTPTVVNDYQGYKALVLTKSSGGYFDGSNTMSGSFGLSGNGSIGDKWMVSAGQRIGAAFDIRSLGVSNKIRVSFHYWNTSWGNLLDTTPVEFTITPNGWSHVELTHTAPANAQAVVVIAELWSPGDKRWGDVNGAAIRKAQFHKLATGEPIPPSTESEQANNTPTAVTDTLAVTAGGVKIFSPIANDTDANSDWLTVGQVSSPAHGTATVNAGQRMVTYTPAVGYTGTDSFTYTVLDGRGGVATGLVNATVAVRSPFSDNFNRANEALDVSANWSTIGPADKLFVASNRIDSVWMEFGPGKGSVALSPDLETYNHYVEGTVGSTGKGDPASFIVGRVTDVDNWVGIRYSTDGTPRIELYTRIGGTFTELAQINGTRAESDIMRLSIVGNTASIKVNGTTILAPTTITMPAASTRTGIFTSGGGTTNLTDNYQAGPAS